jgi:S1-C subfamily serine protease
VLEAANGRRLASSAAWKAEIAGVAAGASAVLLVNRYGERREVTLVAVPRPAVQRPLGLTLQPLSGAGVQVTRVDPGSAAAAAGVRPGDIITLAGTTPRPTRAQLQRAFLSQPADQPLLLAITRDAAHLVLALTR